MLFAVLTTIFLAGLSTSSAYQGGGGPVDCAFSVWSEWNAQGGGQIQTRSRHIYRQASDGGRPCHGRTVQYRRPDDEPDNVPAEDRFLSRFLPGDRPSYSLGGGNSNSRYTLSRDILVMLDTTIGSTLFPYYKALASNLVGKICGDIGTNPEHNRIALATFDYRANSIHDFDEQQSRAGIQDEILRVTSSRLSSNLQRALFFARTNILNEEAGIRRYSNSTKEVLLVTAHKEYCDSGILRAARRLAAHSIVYVIVVGEGVTNSRPADWCLEDHVASDPSEFHFLHLENVERISHVSSILLGQRVDNNKFCRSNRGAK